MGWRKSQFNGDFIKTYNKKHSRKGHLFQIDIKNLVNFHELYNNLPFFPQIIKSEKVEKLEANLHDREEYLIQVRNLKHALNHGLLFTKVHRAIRFNQKAWLKTLIDINTELRKNAKNDFEKDKQTRKNGVDVVSHREN